MRNVLPQRRASETFEVEHGSKRCAVTVGFYGDGSLGEVFVTAPKAGSELEAIARDGAVLLSIAIQHRVPLDVMRHAITREGDGRASTIIGAVIDRLVADAEGDKI
jgi:ribonucleoside-diphosphate reductase alpha chain